MYNPSAAHMRQSSIGPGFSNPHPSSSTQFQSPALAARITQKKVELENLRQLRDLSASLAAQLKELEAKLSTLTDGTEAVATVLANWNNVLRAINMASMKVGGVVGAKGGAGEDGGEVDDGDGKEGGGGGGKLKEQKKEMPEQLVRVPLGLQ